MSSNAEIAAVHRAESKMKLKPHLASIGAPSGESLAGPLRVTLAELFPPELMKKLREMRLL